MDDNQHTEIKELRALVRDILMVLDTATRNYANELDQMHQLLVKSEERIDRTNTMVHELTTTVCGLKDAYMKHIDQAVASRDRVLDENQSILRRMEQTELSLRQERDRYDNLLQSIVDMVAKTKGASGTAVNIKK